MVNSFQVSYRNAFFIVVLFVIIVVSVGLMAGLIGKDCPSFSPEGQDPTTTPPTTLAPFTEITTPSWEDEPWRDPFLPRFLYPIHYDLWFHPDFYYDGNTFKGEETIHINVTKDTRFLIVHIKLMNITQASVTDGNGEEITIARNFSYVDNQYWVTETSSIIPQGSVVLLNLHFEGSLTEGIVGYYKSTYQHAETGVEG